MSSFPQRWQRIKTTSLCHTTQLGGFPCLFKYFHIFLVNNLLFIVFTFRNIITYAWISNNDHTSPRFLDNLSSCLDHRHIYDPIDKRLPRLFLLPLVTALPIPHQSVSFTSHADGSKFLIRSSEHPYANS